MPAQTDHDALITLIETVKNNNTTMISQIADVKTEVQKVNDGITKQVMDHEARLKAVEKIHDTVDPLKTYNDFVVYKTKQEQFEFKWKFVIAIAVVIGGFVEWLISSGINLIFSFWPHH